MQHLAPLESTPVANYQNNNLIIQWNSDSDSATPVQVQKTQGQDKGKQAVALNKFHVFNAMPNKLTLKTILVGPSAPSLPKDPLITIIPSLIKEQVMSFINVNPFTGVFNNLNMIDINLNEPIPIYFNDLKLLVHLAFISYP